VAADGTAAGAFGRAGCLSFYPTNRRADYAQYKIGLAHFRQMRGPQRDQTETREAIKELQSQVEAHVKDQAIVPAVYPHQIAFNALPQVDVFLDNGYTKEEMKLVNESRKILHLPDLRVSCTAVRVPVFVAHSEAVHVETSAAIGPDRARALFAAVPGVIVQDDPPTSTYPLATAAAGLDDIFVGRVRQDPSMAGGRGLAFWVVSDNLRKGAATNAVQIAEVLVERGWLGSAAARGAVPYASEDAAIGTSA